ncbi:hypothetical protein TNCV_3742951 [Trichonephila clavipes]|nr:hypothetical protein TNCV_3742951 [Trichonephila clavipes]
MRGAQKKHNEIGGHEEVPLTLKTDRSYKDSRKLDVDGAKGIGNSSLRSHSPFCRLRWVRITLFQPYTTISITYMRLGSRRNFCGSDEPR